MAAVIPSIPRQFNYYCCSIASGSVGLHANSQRYVFVIAPRHIMPILLWNCNCPALYYAYLTLKWTRGVITSSITGGAFRDNQITKQSVSQTCCQRHFLYNWRVTPPIFFLIAASHLQSQFVDPLWLIREEFTGSDDEVISFPAFLASKVFQ